MPTNPHIQAYVDAVNAQFDLIDPAVDGITDDVAFLNETIAALQNTPSDISAEDQVLLDAAQARVTSLASRVSALDGQTARPTPPTP